MDALRPFEPSAARPWDHAAASHLLRRAGFAPSALEVARALERGPARTVAELVDGAEESPRHVELDEIGATLAVRDDIAGLRGWWLLRMVHTRRPLHARMALFWHDWFATSNEKVGSAALMLQQLRTFERHALGRFGDLVRAVSQDPAMIVWLDGDENVRGRPNENYARELFELFTLGVGNYSETDVREAARAFTGWHQRQGRFHFVEGAHDAGEKTVLGTRGRLDGDDVIELALRQSACAARLARGLLAELLGPEPPEELVRTLGGRLRATDYDVADAVRTVLGGAELFDGRWYRARIKSPVEFAVGVVRSLEMGVPAQSLAQAVSEMGQRLFEPPSVKGWDGHRAWLNSATMMVRMNGARRAVQGGFDAEALCGRYGLDSAAAAREFAARLALDGRVPDALRGLLADASGPPHEVLRSALLVLMSSPEYQMA